MGIKQKFIVAILLVIFSAASAYFAKEYERKRILNKMWVESLDEVINPVRAMRYVEKKYKCKKIVDEKMLIKSGFLFNTLCDTNSSDLTYDAYNDLKDEWDLYLERENRAAIDRAKTIYDIKEYELNKK